MLHSWQDDLDKLSTEDNAVFAEEFVTEAFSGILIYGLPQLSIERI